MIRSTALFAMAIVATAILPNHPTSQDRPTVVIDAGHGGEEIGVEHNGWLEKDLVLEISFVIGAEFAKAGYDVIYTRTGDHAVAWNDRRGIAEEAGADLLFMLHANGNEDLNRHGAEVYGNLDNRVSARLANDVGNALRATGSAVVVEPRDWPFLQSTAVPTAMIELAFMTHPVESRLLRSSDYHHELGRALVTAAGVFLSGP